MPPVASPAPPPPASASGAASSTPSITITGPSAGSIIVPASLPPPPPPAHPDHQPVPAAATASTTGSKKADRDRSHHSASAAGSVAGGAAPNASSKQGQGSFMAVGIAAGAEDAKYQAKYKELKRKVKDIETDNDKLNFKVQQAKMSIRRMKMERAVLYERLSAVPPTSPAERLAAPSIDGVLGHPTSSQHHSQQQQAIQQQSTQHPHYVAPQQHHRQHTPSSQQPQYVSTSQPPHYAPPPPVPQSPVYAPYPGAQHDIHSSSRSARDRDRDRDRDMYSLPMDSTMDAPHARQLLSPRGGPLSAQPPGSATALYPPPLPSGYEDSPPVRHRSHSGSTRSAAGPPSAGAYRSHYPPEGPMGMHSPPPSDRDIRDRDRDRYERERDRDRDRKSHGHYDARERRLSEAQEYDSYYDRVGPPPPPPAAPGHYAPSHSPQMSMAPQILSPRSSSSTSRIHAHQRLGPGTYVNRDSRERDRERDRDDFMDDLRRDPREARYADVMPEPREWDMRERDRERDRDNRRSDRDRDRHRDRAERERERDQDYYRERDYHYRERDREYAPPSSVRGDLPPSNSAMRASPHLHPRTVSGSASSRSRSQIDSRPGEYDHHHVSSTQPSSANGAPGYYQDGYARVSRSGTPPSGEGEVHSRSDSHSRDYYDRDGGHSSARSVPPGSGYRIRRDDADYVGAPAELAPGHAGNGSSGGGNTPAIESRKRSRSEMEMDVDSGDVDVHGDLDAGATIAAGGMGAGNHSALPDSVAPSSDDRSAKRYHRDHSRRRSIDALEDSRLGPS